MNDRRRALVILTANTLAFTVCFAVWMMNGVLATFLAAQGVMELTRVQIGWLMAAPLLTGALLRLPAGILTDRYGGRPVFTGLLVISAAAAFAISFAQSFGGLLLGSLGFGIAGSSFAVGIAYTSVWFDRKWQGTALGIFGAGNAGAALTALVGPKLLDGLTAGGASLEGWRAFPRLYAVALFTTAVLFWLVTVNRKPEELAERSLIQRLQPLKQTRVWRFGLYYVLVFGGYVALAQWLIPYYVGAYAMSLATAGLVSLMFTLPGGVIRALGGLLSDVFGARTVTYWILGGCAVCCLLLAVPRMDMTLPGEAVVAADPGVVTALGPDAVVVDGTRYQLRARSVHADEGTVGGIWPVSRRWHEPAVSVGDRVQARALLARGVTHYYFDADVRVFTFLVLVLGVLMGIGKASVYKYIPDYFPRDVGGVGGLVGVLGALGGSALAVAFGYALEWTGVWTTSWLILFAVAAAALVWLHQVVRRLTRHHAPAVFRDIEDPGAPPAITLRVQCPKLGAPAILRVEPAWPARGAAPGERVVPARIVECSLWSGASPAAASGGPPTCACVEVIGVKAGPPANSAAQLPGQDRRQ